MFASGLVCSICLVAPLAALILLFRLGEVGVDWVAEVLSWFGDRCLKGLEELDREEIKALKLLAGQSASSLSETEDE